MGKLKTVIYTCGHSETTNGNPKPECPRCKAPIKQIKS